MQHISINARQTVVIIVYYLHRLSIYLKLRRCFKMSKGHIPVVNADVTACSAA